MIEPVDALYYGCQQVKVRVTPSEAEEMQNLPSWGWSLRNEKDIKPVKGVTETDESSKASTDAKSPSSTATPATATAETSTPETTTTETTATETTTTDTTATETTTTETTTTATSTSAVSDQEIAFQNQVFDKEQDFQSLLLPFEKRWR